MKHFEINRNIIIKCETKKTRNGFKHIAILQNNLCEDIEQVQINYCNRTWEQYEYKDVLQKLAKKTTTLSAGQKKTLNKYIENGARVEDSLKPLKTIAMSAGLGEVFGKTQKEKNDWKVRMLKAGLAGQGLIMPENWNELSEKDKEARLNGAIEQLK